MEKKFFYVSPKPNRALKSTEMQWDHYISPFRIAPHVYSVGGNDDVSVFLLDTGEGLILIDTATSQYRYLLIDSIYQLGYNVRDIKKILCSHWHFDHTGNVRALVELTNAEVWLSSEDEVVHQKFADDKGEMYVDPYTVTNFYDDSSPIQMGRFTIKTRLCPGHTPGATSFFFEDVDEDGKVYRCAMHGGLGVNPMMTKEFLAKMGYPESMAHQFIRDCEELAKLHIDIALPSHFNQANLEPNLPEDRSDFHFIVNDYAWSDVLINRAEATKDLYPEIYRKKEE